jgi:hypothetical protein
VTIAACGLEAKGRARFSLVLLGDILQPAKQYMDDDDTAMAAITDNTSAPDPTPVWERAPTMFGAARGWTPPPPPDASAATERQPQEEELTSASEQRAALLKSMDAPQSALAVHDKPEQEDSLPRRKRLCPNWRTLQHTGLWSAAVVFDDDAQTIDLVSEDDRGCDGMAVDEEVKAATAEPRTPSRSPMHDGGGVDEQLLSAFLGTAAAHQYTSQLLEPSHPTARPLGGASSSSTVEPNHPTARSALIAKAQAVRTQKLAAVATNFGGSYAAAQAAKQIVQRNACESCGGFGARCMDCPDWRPNTIESNIECPDRERPMTSVYRPAAAAAAAAAGETRQGLHAPVGCVPG